MQLYVDGLPDHAVHVSRFGRQDYAVLELNAVARVDAVLGHSESVCTLQLNVASVLLSSVLNRTASLPDVDITTLAEHTVNTRSLQSQVTLHMLKKTGNFLQGKAHRLEL